VKINWNKYKIKYEAAFIDEFISYLNFFKRFLEKYELKLLTKSEQSEYLLAKKNYINCFEKDGATPPEIAKESKKSQLIKYRHQLLKLTIKAYELSDRIQNYFTREDKFEDINKVYEKYRPLLYETNLKEKPKKTTQINNKSSFKQLFNGKSNLAKNISRLKKLYENGSLSKVEFEKAKNKLLK
jgi:hypothetical protein